ncbi:MAG: FG-GAP-like repeat-containing protein [Woeseiaceae bacterium]
MCALVYSILAVQLVFASGFPPVANDDNMIAVRGGTTTTLSDGSTSILDNDFDAEGDSLFIYLTRNVRRGTLTLNADGTFVYVHNGSRRNSDEFRYILYDGTGFSAQARVRIDVVNAEPVPPEIVGQDNVTMNEDSSLTIDIRSLDVVDPDNNFPGDFTLEVRNGENYSRNNQTITPAQDFNGQLAVPVRVFDGTNFSNLYSLDVDVRPRNDAPFTVGSPPDQEAIENTQFTLALANYFDDIDANDSLTFSASGLPGSRSLDINRDTGVLSGAPVAADVNDDAYNVTITATDSGGLRATVSFLLTIYPDDRSDLAVTAALAVNPVSVGEAAQWNIVVDNLGPADVEAGELVAQWSTSGPNLSLAPVQGCELSSNNSRTPELRCSLNGLAADESLSFSVQGTQDSDGDNSLIVTAVADDPITTNNSTLVGGQVVAAFSEGPTQILGVSGAGVASGDLNGDGNPDLVVTEAETVVFLNDGNRALTTPGISLGPDSGGIDVVLLDWNGDSHLDVAVAGAPDQAARVYLNDGAGELSGALDLSDPDSGTISAAAAADFDQDGFSDLVLTGSGASRLLRSSGQAEFFGVDLPAGPGIDVSIADIDNNGFPDIIVVESGDRSVNLLRNLGDGIAFAAERLQRGSVASATGTDLNGDGSTDLMLAIDGDDLSPPQSRVLYQQSDGAFPDGEIIGASPLSEMLAGDVDGDSVMDIVAVNAAGVHQLYRGAAGGQFALSAAQIVSEGMRGGILTDFNTDDSIDLIIAGPNSGVVEIHANNGNGSLGLGDRQAPDMQLLGEATVSIAAGTVFVDPGVTVTDDIDGDLTDAVVVTGNLDSGVVGSYTLRYSVTDRAGNLAAATRVIDVGINKGVGGGGGGAISLSFIVLQMLLLMSAIYFRARTGYGLRDAR